MPSQVRILTFPYDDDAFRSHVEAAETVIGRWDPDRVLSEIRTAYPLAAIHEAHELGRLQAWLPTWYVYRDGGPTTNHSTEAWWLDDTQPATVMTRDGQYVDANPEAAELFGVDVETIRRGRAGDFTRHEGSDEVRRRLFEALAATGTLHSTALVLRPDGEHWPIEYHVREEGDRRDRYRTVMRRINR